MAIKEHINYWLKTAAHDMEAAETLFQNRKYDWCLFIGHLVIEKILKAFYVRDKQEIPPKMHNLVTLTENTNLSLSDEQMVFLANLNGFFIVFQQVGCTLKGQYCLAPTQREPQIRGAILMSPSYQRTLPVLDTTIGNGSIHF